MITADANENTAFWAGVIGQRLVKRTVKLRRARLLPPLLR
jgi:catechol 2,3-dioxygenase-like lactoylglutathione lyase family enzyme